jgi:hypothetical protein
MCIESRDEETDSKACVVCLLAFPWQYLKEVNDFYESQHENQTAIVLTLVNFPPYSTIR